MNKRVSVWTISVLLLTMAASSASAATCRKKITTFWGYVSPQGQPECYVLIGPPSSLVEIGQIIRECDDSTWSWGRTDCTHPDGITVEYEDCECEASLETAPSDEKPAAASCAAQTAE